MWSPAHRDGCDLVIPRQVAGVFGWRFKVVDSGYLSHNGEVLTFCSEKSPAHEFTETEQARLPVSPENRIAQCIGFRLFMIE